MHNKLKIIVTGVIFIILFMGGSIFNSKELIYTYIEPEVAKAENYSFDEDKNISAPIFMIGEKSIKAPILLYHEVAKEVPNNKQQYTLVTTPEKFEQDIFDIINSGYTVISLDRLIQYKNSEKGIPEKCLVITLDDGYISNYTMVYPILKKYNVPATIFVVNNLVGTYNYFSWEQAKEMEASGLVRIYSHGYEHVKATTLSKDEFREEVSLAETKLQENLGEHKYKVYSYPFGVRNEETDNELIGQGYQFLMVINSKTNTIKDIQKGLLNRMAVPYNYSISKILALLR